MYVVSCKALAFERIIARFRKTDCPTGSMLKKMSMPVEPHCSIHAPLMFGTIIYTAILLIKEGSTDVGLWILFAAQAAGIITNWINRRAEAKIAAQKHEWEREERREIAAQAAALRVELANNTDVTVKAAETAEKAFDAANHVNEKIARIAAGHSKD